MCESHQVLSCSAISHPLLNQNFVGLSQQALAEDLR